VSLVPAFVRAIVVLGAFAIPARAQSPDSVVLRGRLIDAKSTRPLGAASVVVTAGRDTIGRAETDSSGLFIVPLRRAGSYIVHFQKLAYRPDSVIGPGDPTAPMRVAMAPLEMETPGLPAVRVDASTLQRDLKRRAARANGGIYILHDEIVRRNPARTSDLLRSVPSVMVTDSAGVTQVVSTRGMRPNVGGLRSGGAAAGSGSGPPGGSGMVEGRGCTLRVMVDAKLMPPGFSVNDVVVGSLDAIEVYVGAATLPAEFTSVQRDAACGLVMLWTRSGTLP
jgi:hypothetical protein